MFPPVYFILLVCVSSIHGMLSTRCKAIVKEPCPRVKPTICIGVRHKDVEKGQDKTAYYMTPRCELERNKCNEDLEITELPIGFCKDNILETAPHSAPVLREGSRKQDPDVTEVSHPEVLDAVEVTNENVAVQDTKVDDVQVTKEHIADTVADAVEVTKENTAGQDTKVDDVEVTKENTADQDTKIDDVEVTKENTAGQDTKVDDVEVTKENVAGQDTKVDDVEVTKENAAGQDTKVDDVEVTQENTAGQNSKVDDDEVTRENTAGQDTKVDDPEVTQENTGQENNKDGNGAECPAKCPTRDVMVCARCPHGIYRTFMSACYMRMYQCQNPNEKLELVTRHACLMSAPYLGDMARPSDSATEANDNDPVLGYIFAKRSSSEEKKNS